MGGIAMQVNTFGLSDTVAYPMNNSMMMPCNQGEFAQKFPPAANNTQGLIEINAGTFLSYVPLVTLDEYYSYYGEKICRVCGGEFSPKSDHRILPCKHVFHGQCIYNWMVINNKKYCPVDNARYA